jgi:hypothetical protein
VLYLCAFQPLLQAGIAPVDSVARYKKDFCKEIFLGDAAFTGSNTIRVTSEAHGSWEGVAFGYV